MYKIPLFNLNYDERENNAVIKTLNSKWISTGPKAIEFEKKFASILNVEHAVTTSNCTAALHLALKLSGIKEGDEVICPSLTFVATVNAVLYMNAKPVFVDVKSYENLTISPEEITEKITSKTKAIIVMHYGGFACDMDAIMAIAKKNNLKVIEDASHAPLAEYNDKKLGTIGDIGCFSFFSNKNISTGEGGMLVTNNAEHDKNGRLLRSHGMTSLSFQRAEGHATEYDVLNLGYNYRMDDIRATLGIAQLDKLHDDLLKRIKVRKWYEDCLNNDPRIIVPFCNYNHFSSNYIMTIILKDSTKERRDSFREKLHNSGIQTSIHYPAVHQFTIYKEMKNILPITEYIADNIVTLPMYSALKKEDVNLICDIVLKSI